MAKSGDESRARDAERTERPGIAELLWDHERIEAALKRAVREALVRHKRLGQSISVWRDGKVVRLSADEIPV